MQVCPALSSLPQARRSAARSKLQSGATSTGDLPPSSSVKGVKLGAAAAATLRPTVVEPVKIKWSKGKALKRAASSASPGTTTSSVASKAWATKRCSKALKRGVSSEGLIITRLPAASASMVGAMLRSKG